MTNQAKYLCSVVNQKRLMALFQDTGSREARVLARYAQSVVEKYQALALHETELAPRIAREAARLPYRE